MRVIGKAATSIAVVAAAGALVVGVRSIPDIKRYVKIRSM